MRFLVNITELQSAATGLGEVASKLSEVEASLSSFSFTATLGDSSKLINDRIRDSVISLSEETAHVRGCQEKLFTIISYYEDTENAILGNNSARNVPAGTRPLTSSNGGDNTSAESSNNEIDEKLAEDIKKALAWKWEYSRVRWLFSSPEERKQTIRDMLALLAPVYGISAPTLIIGPEENPTPGLVTGGYFQAETNTIWINEDFFENGFIGRDDAVHTLLHEMRHAYQYDVINNPDNYKYDEETINQWKNDYYGYISAEDDFDAYDNQAIETDADDFADRIQKQDWWY